MPEEQSQTKQPESLEIIRYREELAEKVGLHSPYGMQVLKGMCEDMVNSGLVPQCFGKNPLAVYAAAMRGREMGLSPSESIFETFWAAPGGRLGMYAGKMLQIMHRGGVQTEFTTTTAEECIVRFIPLAPHKPIEVSFRFQEANNAGLVKPDSNWKKWPADMCRARCIARGWRMLLGSFEGSANLYAKEELEDIPVDTSAVIAQEKAAEKETMAAFNPGRKKKPVIISAPDVDSVKDTPAPVPVFSPRDALAVAIGAKTNAEFDFYAKSVGLDKLEGEEYTSFCLLGAKLLDMTNAIRLCSNGGYTYTSLIAKLDNMFGSKVEEIKRPVLQRAIEELLNGQTS